MATCSLIALLRVVMIIICAGWVSIWILKPTRFWTNIWKDAEDQASTVVFGYNGLNFATYTLPIIALAIVGFVYVNLQSKVPRRRKALGSKYAFSNPILVNSLLGTISAAEILAVFLFVLFLAWTFYARISNDFKHLQPVKSLKLNLWQLKYLRVATRFGLLAEACLALLLLPVLRGLAVFRVLGIQFEASVRYHIWLGTAMVFFAAIHGGSTLFIWGVSNSIQDEIWKWQKNGRIYLAGEVALITALVIWITSLPQIRRKKFEIFYYAHHLYMIFLIFFLFHGGDGHFYTVFPGMFLFGLDRLLRFVHSGPETCVLSARLFPCKAIELILPKDRRLSYAPTSIVFMKVPSISVLQWHSFSISSSSSVDDSTLSIIIKREGRWTRSLYGMLSAELETETEKIKCIPVAIEGPYGPSSMDFLRYDSLLLIAGGIGITPFLSMLQEIASNQARNALRIPAQIQLLYVVKKSEQICLLNSVSSLLMTQSSKQWNLKLKFFVTQEEQTSATVKQLLNEQSQAVQTIHFNTNRVGYAVHGMENFTWLGAVAGLSSITFLLCLILFNHFFVPARKPSKQKLLASKEKFPSSVSDLLLICSFIVSMMFGTAVATVLRWRRLEKGIPLVSQKQGKATEPVSRELTDSLEEHEIHYGGRPNFQDVLFKFLDETGGSGVGVFVCGPESMKEAVASICKRGCQDIRNKGKEKTPYITFHSLNFSL